MRGKTLIAAGLLSLVITSKSSAQSTLRLEQHRPEGSSVLKDPTRSRPAQVYGLVRFEGMQYLSPIPDEPSLTYGQLLSGRISLLKEASWADGAMDISGGTFFSRGQSHYVVHELYLASKGKEFKAYLGRKKKDWSEMDRRWQLGIFQPTFAIDALRPEEQGLTGLFLDYNTDKFEVLGFASPVFVPSMGPDIREEGGGLVADSRWYRAPSRDYDFNRRINTIQYNLDIPDAMKLASNASVALMSRLGNKERGLWSVASLGYMPVNELILTRQNFKTIDEDRVDVVVSPAVTHHYVWSMDIGYSFPLANISFSYIQDDPETKLPEKDWAIQKLEPLRAYSAALDFTLENFLGRTLSFELGYMKAEGGRVQDIRDDGADDSFTLFDRRLKFYDVSSVRMEGQLASVLKKPLVLRFQYLYDYAQKGSLLNTEFLYYPSPKWALIAGADVLGVQTEDENSSDFLNQYRANDRVYGGMTYVF